MPIKIPNGLPAKEILESEKIFALEEEAAVKQDIRPLKVLILNLMPKKIETETQILRLISKSPLQVDIDFLKMSDHISKNTSNDHLVKFYDDFAHISDNTYDALIITGAPVEQLAFEEVDYWEELCIIMEWSKQHVFSTLHICWGAQAGLYHHHKVNKKLLEHKMFGIFPQILCDEYNFLTNGFDELHNTPHSRHTAIDEEALAKVKELEVLSKSEVTGTNIVARKDFRQIFILGHLEYGKETLSQEYFRDIEQGKEIQVPFNYFPNDDPSQEPIFTWRSHANLLYRNWLNYVYQMTPFDLADLDELK